MPTPTNLEKAKLFQIDWVEEEVELRDPSKPVKVQFNPETLTVNYGNKAEGGDQRGGSALQYVGQGTTKLSLELWFDVTGQQPEGAEAQNDVRKMTEKVIDFIHPKKEGSGDQTKYKIPGMRLLWGSFIFDGVVESINEKLEFFSEDGRPLRAQLSLSLSSQSFQFQFNERNNAGANPAATTPGSTPLTQTPNNQPLQQLASGSGTPWQDIARANGIENPRQLTAGALLNLNASASVSAGASITGGVSGSASLSVSAKAGATARRR